SPWCASTQCVGAPSCTGRRSSSSDSHISPRLLYALWHLQKLSRVPSSCWLAVSWRSIGRLHAHNVLVQALRSRQRPVQVESAAHGLFRLNALGSGFRGLVGGAAAWPLLAHAQKQGAIGKIGYVHPVTIDQVRSVNLSTMIAIWRELGYVEG